MSFDTAKRERPVDVNKLVEQEMKKQAFWITEGPPARDEDGHVKVAYDREFGKHVQCTICGKEFLKPSEEWVYKFSYGGVTYFFCSWTCQRKWEKENRKLMSNPERRLRMENKAKT